MKAMVLLSGGVDSTAAAIYAVNKYQAENVSALAIDYGQSHRDAELAASQVAARRLGIEWERVCIADALRGGVADGVPRRGTTSKGASRATTPARNIFFLALACNRAGVKHPNETTIIVIGTHKDDASAFADCRKDTTDSFQTTGNLALRDVSKILIAAPWISYTKAGIVRVFKEDEAALSLLRDSVSCYAGTRCGECDSCAQRAQAFADNGIEDGTKQWIMRGGDPHRDAALSSG